MQTILNRLQFVYLSFCEHKKVNSGKCKIFVVKSDGDDVLVDIFYTHCCYIYVCVCTLQERRESITEKYPLHIDKYNLCHFLKELYMIFFYFLFLFFERKKTSDFFSAGARVGYS